MPLPAAQLPALQPLGSRERQPAGGRAGGWRGRQRRAVHPVPGGRPEGREAMRRHTPRSMWPRTGSTNGVCAKPGRRCAIAWASRCLRGPWRTAGECSCACSAARAPQRALYRTPAPATWSVTPRPTPASCPTASPTRPRYFVLWPEAAALTAEGQRFLVDAYGRGGLLLMSEVRGVWWRVGLANSGMLCRQRPALRTASLGSHPPYPVLLRCAR